MEEHRLNRADRSRGTDFVTVLLLGLLLAVPRLSAVSPADPVSVRIAAGTKACDEADKLLAEGRTDEALKLYQEVLTYLPTSPRAKAGVARCRAPAASLSAGPGVSAVLCEGFMADGPAVPGRVLAFSPDASLAVCGDPGNHSVRLRDAATGAERATLRDASDRDTSWTFSADGRWLAAIGQVEPDIDSHTTRTGVTVWSVADGAPRWRQPLYDGRGMAFSPDGSWLAVVARPPGVGKGVGAVEVMLFDATTGEKRSAIAVIGSALAFSPDGRRLAVVDWGVPVDSEAGPRVAIHDVDSGAPRYTLVEDAAPVAPGAWQATDPYLVRFMAGGERLVSVGRSGRVRVWELATAKLLRQRAGPETWLCQQAALSPDGSRLAVAGGEGSEVLTEYDLATGDTVYRQRWLGGVWAVGYTSDGHLRVAAGDGRIHHREGEAGVAWRRLGWSPKWLDRLTFSADGATIAAAYLNRVFLWDHRTGETRWLPAWETDGSRAKVDRIAFSRDRRSLATVCQELGAKFLFQAWLLDSSERRNVWPGKAAQRLWEEACVSGYKPPWGVPRPFPARLPDGRAAEAEGERIVLSADAAGARRTLTGHLKPITALAATPDGRTLISVDLDHRVMVWDVAAGTQRSTWQVADDGHGIDDVVLSPDGRLAAAVPRCCGRLRLFDAASGEPLATLENTGWQADFSADGRVLVTNLMQYADQPDAAGHRPGKHLVSADWGGVALWDTATGKLIQRIVTSRFAVSPDGRWLVTNEPALSVWDLATRQRVAALPACGHYQVNSLAFSPDGRTVATKGTGPAALWDLGTGTLRLRLPVAETNDYSYDVAFSRDGRRLCVEGAVWDPATGRKVCALDGPSMYSAFTPDGRAIVTTTDGRDRPVAVYDAATGQRLRTVGPGGIGWSKSLALSADGRMVAWSAHPKYPTGGSTPAMIVIADLATGRVLRKLAGHPTYIWRLAFSPDGRTLASAWRDGAAALWDVAGGARRVTLVEPKPMDQGTLYLPRDALGADGYQDVAFSPDGRTVALGAVTKVILFDARTGAWKRTLFGGEGALQSAPLNTATYGMSGKVSGSRLAFSPDGRTIAGTTDNGGIITWEARGTDW